VVVEKEKRGEEDITLKTLKKKGKSNTEAAS
jgi:hypothetical protein